MEKIHPDTEKLPNYDQAHSQEAQSTAFEQPVSQLEPYPSQPFQNNHPYQIHYQGAPNPQSQNYSQHLPSDNQMPHLPIPSYSIVVGQNQMCNFISPPVIDFGLVPEGSIFYSNDCPALDKPTKVEYNITEEGNIESFDETLDSDVIQSNKEEEIWRYFMCNLKAPSQQISIRGHHSESRKVSRNGSMEDETHDVVDFDIRIDLSSYVSPAWSRIYCEPIPGQPLKGYKQTLKEYTESDRNIKEIHMKKYF